MKSSITDLDGVYSGSAVFFSECVPSPQVTTSSLRFKKATFQGRRKPNSSTLPPDCWPWENLYIIIWFYHSLLVFIGQSCSFVLCLFFNFEMFNHPCVSVVATKVVETGEHGNHGDSPWLVEGPCETVGSCVQSPNYPTQYPNGQSCSLSLPKPSVVTILDFLTPAVN